MKTTELIEKVKNANSVTIIGVTGKVCPWTSMRELGHVLYNLFEIVQEDSDMYRLYEKADGSLVIAPRYDDTTIGEYKISHPLEFDSFGELESWSRVTDEEAVLLLTKADPEPEPINTQKTPNAIANQVFKLLGLDINVFEIVDADDFYRRYVDIADTAVDINYALGTVDVRGEDGEVERSYNINITLEDQVESKPYVEPVTQPRPADWRG